MKNVDVVVVPKGRIVVFRKRQEMNQNGYEFEKIEPLLQYHFFSEGPNGKIEKVVRFSKLEAKGIPCFNLAFGDWDVRNMIVDDLARSNNQDVRKIFATIADIVLDFTRQFTGVYVHAIGSTQSRTRMYQMGISANWSKITPLFYVYGQKDGEWGLFLRNVNYDAFLVIRK